MYWGSGRQDTIVTCVFEPMTEAATRTVGSSGHYREEHDVAPGQHERKAMAGLAGRLVDRRDRLRRPAARDHTRQPAADRTQHESVVVAPGASAQVCHGADLDRLAAVERRAHQLGPLDERDLPAVRRKERESLAPSVARQRPPLATVEAKHMTRGRHRRDSARTRSAVRRSRWPALNYSVPHPPAATA